MTVLSLTTVFETRHGHTRDVTLHGGGKHMYFTVIFEGEVDDNWAYGLSFLPSPVWLKQGSGDVTLNDGLPHGDALGTPANFLKVIEPLTSNFQP